MIQNQSKIPYTGKKVNHFAVEEIKDLTTLSNLKINNISEVFVAIPI